MAYRIVESIHGTWHYHLTDQPPDGSSAHGLCGARTMRSSAPLSSWGYKPDHMPSSYCKDCEKLAGIVGHSKEGANVSDCDVSRSVPGKG